VELELDKLQKLRGKAWLIAYWARSESECSLRGLVLTDTRHDGRASITWGKGLGKVRQRSTAGKGDEPPTNGTRQERGRVQFKMMKERRVSCSQLPEPKGNVCRRLDPGPLHQSARWLRPRSRVALSRPKIADVQLRDLAFETRLCFRLLNRFPFHSETVHEHCLVYP
jgi:hypothetical protein